MLCQALKNMGRSWYSVYRKNGKLGNRGTPTIFVGHVKNHAGDCYRMYNPNTGYVTETRDIMWLYHMYYGKPEARDEAIVYPQVVLPFEPDDAEAREGVMFNASEPKVKSKNDKKEWSNLHMRSGRVVKPLVLYMREFSTNSIEGALSTIHQNCYAQLHKLDDE